VNRQSIRWRRIAGLALIILLSDWSGLKAATNQVATDQQPLEIYQLPWQLHQDLPALELTVRYAPADPKQRFARINGIRVQQGDHLEDGPLVAEIRADGVILEYQGQRFIIR